SSDLSGASSTTGFGVAFISSSHGRPDVRPPNICGRQALGIDGCRETESNGGLAMWKTVCGLQIAIVVAFAGISHAQSAASTSTAHSDDPCKRWVEYLPAIEHTCLSNSSTGYRAALVGAIDVLRRSIRGEAKVSADEIHGARANL